MHVTISEDGVVGLTQVGEFNAFDVRVASGTVGDVLAALGDRGGPADEDDHVFVAVDAIRELAGGAADDDWEAGFAAMLEFAKSHGWMDASDTMIKAHLRTD